MKTASVREVRHEFSKVMDWVRDGESVEVSKRGEVIAVISPPAPKVIKKVKWPDLFARFERNYGKDWKERAKQQGENFIVAERYSRDY